MATVREIYQLIKEREKQGKKIGILQQSIIDAYEADEPKTTKEVDVTFKKNENQNTRQPTQNTVEQKEQSE